MSKLISIWVLTTSIICIGGCSLLQPKSYMEKSLIDIIYLSGGDLPTATQLRVLDDYSLILESHPGRFKRKFSNQNELSDILDIISEKDFLRELEQLSLEHRNDFDWESVAINFQQQQFHISLEKQSRKLKELFLIIDEVYMRKFGRSYQIQLARPVVSAQP